MQRLLPLTVLAFGALLAPGRASAHAILLDSTPGAQSAIPPGMAELRLRFNSRIDHDRSRLVLRRGTQDTPLAIERAEPADILAAPATVLPGAYVIRWQVLAIDGHITRGEVPFTVRAP